MKIFIVGNSRSGTTMLGRVLGGHSQVYTYGELHFFERMVQESELTSPWERDKLISLLERLLTTAREGLFCAVEQGRYKKEAESILKLADKNTPVSIYECFLREETKKNRKNIPCEQTPGYLYSSEFILSLFPDAKIINLIRDPRDVLLSQKNKWRRRFLGAKKIPLSEAFRSWINYHPYTITKLWVSSVRTARKLDEHDRFMSLSFEDLLISPEERVKNICNFLGLDFEANMLNVPKVGSSQGKDNFSQLGIDKSNMSGWKKGGLSQVELAICQLVAGKEMAQLDYSFKDVKIPFWKKWWCMLTFVIKAFIALLLNLKRSKNMIKTIQRRLIKG